MIYIKINNSEKRNKFVRFESCSKGSVQVYSTEGKPKRLPAYTLFFGQNCSGFVDNIVNSWNSKLDPTSPFIHSPTTWFYALIDNLEEQGYCFEYGYSNQISDNPNNPMYESVVLYTYNCDGEGILTIPIDLSL